MSTRFGTQPAYHMIMTERRVSVSEVARVCDLPRRTLHNALFGTVRPHPDIVRKLGEYLGVGPEKMFTPSALSEPNRKRAYTLGGYDGYVPKSEGTPVSVKALVKHIVSESERTHLCP